MNFAICSIDPSSRLPRSTSKERDAESGNDCFEAWYYASSMGRFMSPRPVRVASAGAETSLNWSCGVTSGPDGVIVERSHGHTPKRMDLAGGSCL
jgi:hypothetical protein